MVSLLEDAKLSKPHFRFKAHVWSCATWDRLKGWRVGIGYSVKDAWKDWKEQR
jgi:hypothetical protein